MAINFEQSLLLPDNVKLNVGTGSDLQIYHDGSNSYIEDVAAGDLYIQTNGTNIFLRNGVSGNTFIAMNTGNDTVSLKYNGSTKLTTTNTGISITGGVATTSSSDLAGANMSADIAMGTNAITGMANPSSAQDAATKSYVDSAISGVPQGTVTSVTGSSPISSSGGTTPAISIATANASTTGALTSTDWNTFNNKGSGSMSSWTLTGDSGGSETITNTETVTIAGGTNITTVRSGATVTINTSATTNTGTVTSVGLSAGGDALQITGTPVTTSGTLAINWQGDVEDYINGEGDLTTFPTISNSQITINTGTGLSGGGSFTLNQSGTTTLNLAATNNGTVTSVATTSPITGGTITGSGTIGFDSTAVTSLTNLNTTGTIVDGVWNSDRKFDKTSTTDLSYQGDIVYWHSTTVTAGKIYVYQQDQWAAADADAESTSSGTLAIALGNGASNSVGMLIRGTYTLNYDPGTDGELLYISTTAGNLVTEPPSATGDVVRIVGQLLDTTNGQIFFNPDYTFITLS